jgi:hypothetical protein
MRAIAASLLFCLLAARAFAGDLYWEPKAEPAPQITTITVGGTWSTDDTATVDVGSGKATLDLGAGSTTTADIATDIAAMINADDRTSDLGASYTRSIGGQEVPQIYGLSATVSGSVVTVVGLNGIPFTLTATETSAAGTLGVAEAQAATGPNHFDSADNWDTGALPAGGDVIYFNAGSVDCKYGLDYLRDNTIEASIRLTPGYGGDIGLNVRNTDASSSTNYYTEYRTRALQLYDAGGTEDVTIEAGETEVSGARVWRFDLASQTWDDVIVKYAGAAEVQIWGGSVDTLYVGSGTVGIDPPEAGAVSGCELEAVTIGAPGITGGEPNVTIGPKVVWDGAGTAVSVLSGTVVADCNLDAGAAEATLALSDCTFTARGDGDYAGITVKSGATFTAIGAGTFNSAIVVESGGTLDLSQDARAKSYNGVTVHGPATLKLGNQTPTITYSNVSEDDVTVTR